MQAEREMYQDSHLRGVICNAEMIKREIIEDFGLPAEKIHVIYNAIDNQRFLPPTEAEPLSRCAPNGICQSRRPA
jgi:UDP-glucose:(heptosyl)LPS alpha-1,3-glucosyltransferase